ncbi:DUF3466 family protein [Vibrio sonorensis]|uniref:DUF3466 family protein n=1 Tax=Vibrio sonorensis TaxID=1004316 RepID=UPI0008DA835A|nr:DUF3466 family protein [Vibrio sonorensis]
MKIKYGVFYLSCFLILMVTRPVNAAIYQIEVMSERDNENYASAVAELTTVTDCFKEDCSAIEPIFASYGRIGEGASWLSNEFPFLDDSRFKLYGHTTNSEQYLSYCQLNLKYSNCQEWADNRYLGTQGSGGANRFVNSYTWHSNFNVSTNNNKASATNGVSIISEVSGNISGTNEVLINKVKNELIGSSSSGYMHTGMNNYARQYMSRGFYGTYALEPIVTAQPLDTMGVTRAYDAFEYNGKTYVVGSSAFSIYGNKYDCDTVSDPHTKPQCQNLTFNNQAVVWDVTNIGAVTVSKVTNATTGHSRAKQVLGRRRWIHPIWIAQC